MGSVTVTGLSKRYRYRVHGTRAKRPTDLRFSFGKGHFWALQDIFLSVRPGEMVGIIGANGAGKSTLLRLIGGVGRPTAGGVHVSGQIGALLELGATFHPELTGRENAVLGGIIAGLTRREVLDRMQDIIDFAELRDFIDMPVRSYSSGMMLRLAFAIVANTDPDVLLIDEVLAVGDYSFRAKCLNRVEQFRRRGCAIVLVTHDTRLAAQLCDQVVWLAKGRIMQIGDAPDVVRAYSESMDWETKRRTPFDWGEEVTTTGVELRVMENRFGSLEMRITDVRLIDQRGYPCRRIQRGERLRVEIDYYSNDVLPAPNFGVMIRQDNDSILFDETMAASELGINEINGPGSVAITFDRLDLNGGDYAIDVGVYRHDWAYSYDYHWRAYRLSVIAGNEVKGALNPPHVWEKAQPRTANAG